MNAHQMRQTRSSKQNTERGHLNFCAGQAGEQAALRFYEDKGYRLLAARWRGGGGELDLVLQSPLHSHEGLIFVEVKTSRSHANAAHRISQQQMHRIFTAATVFADQHFGTTLIDMRFDVALVDGVGTVQILENALMAA